MQLIQWMKKKLAKPGKDSKKIKMAEKVYDNANRCVMCGAVIPEGRQVCPICHNSVEQLWW